MDLTENQAIVEIRDCCSHCCSELPHFQLFPSLSCSLCGNPWQPQPAPAEGTCPCPCPSPAPQAVLCTSCGAPLRTLAEW